MSPEKKRAIEQELPTWLYRSLVGFMISVILYFVVDIHQDFEKQKEKIQTLERSDAIQNIQIQNVTSKSLTLEGNQNAIIKYINNKD
jgi:Na+/H+ antiporter NhaC